MLKQPKLSDLKPSKSWIAHQMQFDIQDVR